MFRIHFDKSISVPIIPLKIMPFETPSKSIQSSTKRGTRHRSTGSDIPIYSPSDKDTLALQPHHKVLKSSGPPKQRSRSQEDLLQIHYSVNGTKIQSSQANLTEVKVSLPPLLQDKLPLINKRSQNSSPLKQYTTRGRDSSPVLITYNRLLE